jgi:hypothetical protein
LTISRSRDSVLLIEAFCSVETARHIDKQLSMEDAVALALLITAVTEKALTLCQVPGSEADDENDALKSRLFL